MGQQLIITNGKLFLGRAEQQNRFRSTLSELLNPSHDVDPFVFLLYGDGGSGKSQLAGRFRDIAVNEHPFQGNFQKLWIDWQDEARFNPSLVVERANIRPQMIFDIIHKIAVREKQGSHFAAYQKIIKQIGEADRKAAQVFTSVAESSKFAALPSVSASLLARLARTGMPIIGQSGEKVIEAFAEPGIKVGAEKIAALRADVTMHLKAHLDSEQYKIFLAPEEQLALGLADGLKHLAARRPLIMFLDHYDLVDRQDVWLRRVIKAAGPRIVWVICGRNNLVQDIHINDNPAERIKGYPHEFPSRLISYDMQKLAVEDLDIRTYFTYAFEQYSLAHTNAKHQSLTDADVKAIYHATRGIPLAIDTAAEIWVRGIPLADIIGDITGKTPHKEIVQKMMDCYLQNAVKAEDRDAMTALALARGDVDLLRAMIRTTNGSFNLESLLKRLRRDYACVDVDGRCLYEAPTFYFLESFKDQLRRGEDRIREFNRQAELVLRARLQGLESNLLRLEDRCQQNDWVKATLDLAYYLFWLEEDRAWSWIIPRFVESLAYSSELQQRLLTTVKSWKDYLSVEGLKRLHMMQGLSPLTVMSLDDATALDDLLKLDQLGWLKGRDAAEYHSIILWRQGLLLCWSEKYADALVLLEQSAQSISKTGNKMLEKKLSEALYTVSNNLMWPDEMETQTSPSDLILRASQWASKLDSTNIGALHNTALALHMVGNVADAVDVFRKVIDTDTKRDPAPYNGLADAYSDLGRNEEAIVTYQQAIKFDSQTNDSTDFQVFFRTQEINGAMVIYVKGVNAPPAKVIAYCGLGNVYRKMGRNDEAIAAYQQAITFGPNHGYIYQELGRVYSDLGRNEDAIAAYQKAIILDPNLAVPHYGLGNIYRDSGHTDAAIAAYLKSITIDPKFIAPYNELGNIYTVLGQHNDAISVFKQANTLVPDLALPYHGLGNVYRNLGRTEEAIDAYQKAIGVNPNFAASYGGLGNVYSDLGRTEEAIDAYQKAVDMDPKFAVAYRGLGDGYSDLGRTEEAIDAYQKAISVNPDFAASHYGLGNVYRNLGRIEEAIAAYQKAADADSKLAIAHYRLGEVHMNLGHIEEAIAAYQKAADADPKLAVAHYSLGIAYANLGHTEEAIAAYQKAIAIDAKFSASYYKLGIIYREIGRYDDAIIAYETAIAIDPVDVTFYNGLGNVYVNVGDYDKAIKIFLQAIDLDQNYAKAYHGLGNTYESLQRHEEAITAYQKAAELDPMLAAANYGLGMAYENLGRSEDAIAAYQKAIAIDPKLTAAYLRLASLFSELKKYFEAIAILKQAIGLYPNKAELHHLLGEVYLHSKNYDDAILSLKQAIMFDPNHDMSYYWLGSCYRHLEHIEEAIIAFRQVSILSPNEPISYFALGNIYADLGRDEDAITNFQQAAVLDLNTDTPYYELACVYYKTKRSAEAISTCQIAIKRNPSNCSTYHLLGWVYRDIGQLDEAITSFQEAIKCNPNESRFHYDLGTIYYIRRRYEDAITAYQQAVALNPNSGLFYLGLAAVSRYLGSTDQTKVFIGQARSLLSDHYNLACLESINGDVEAAIRHLQIAILENSDYCVGAQTDADLDFIRNDPRFIGLVAGCDASSLDSTV